jgi:uncharacterized protein GlcG (DUF336 family)
MGIVIKSNNITYQAALAACQSAVEKAEVLKINICVSVCDSSGLELAFLRMNGSYIHSIDIAKNKAYTSASFKFPSGTWTDIFKEVPHLEQGFSNRDKLIPFGGGLPLTLNDEVIGAIGVSGGTEEEDIICAQAGIDAILTPQKKD